MSGDFAHLFEDRTEVKTNSKMKPPLYFFRHFPAILDYPDMEPKGTGTWTFGEFDAAHEEIQKITGGSKTNNVEMGIDHGK